MNDFGYFRLKEATSTSDTYAFLRYCVHFIASWFHVIQNDIEGSSLMVLNKTAVNFILHRCTKFPFTMIFFFLFASVRPLSPYKGKISNKQPSHTNTKS